MSAVQAVSAVPMTDAEMQHKLRLVFAADRLIGRCVVNARRFWRRNFPSRHRLRRVFRQRCEECSYRGRWHEAWHTYGNRDGKVWHGKCIALDQHRRAADEALAVLDLICEVWDVDSRAVQSIAELRGKSTPDEANQANRAWRVMYALDKRRAVTP